MTSVWHVLTRLEREALEAIHPHHDSTTTGDTMHINATIKAEFAALIQAGQHPEEAIHNALEKHNTLLNRADSVLREIADLAASPVGKFAFEALGMPAAEQQFVAHSAYDAASWLHSVASQGQQEIPPADGAPAQDGANG